MSDGPQIDRERGPLAEIPMVERDGRLVPERLPERLEARCPAASIERFKNTGRPAIKCGVADEAMAVEDNPIGVLGWCCGGFESCPIWIAEKDHDPAVARQRVARAVAGRRKQTEDQIRKGIRVDDIGLEQRDAALERESERGRDPERDRAEAERALRRGLFGSDDGGK
jgi:hypothetical protein